MKKNFNKIIILIVIGIILGVVISVLKNNKKVDLFTFELIGDEYTLVNIDKKSAKNGTIIIPGEYNGKLVTSISKINDYDINIEELYLPKTIESISENVFEKVSINYFYYDGTIKDWCDISFKNNYSNPVYRSGTILFKESNSDSYRMIYEINIPLDVLEINDYQFFGFERQVFFVNIHRHVEYISENAFSENNKLEINNESNVYINDNKAKYYNTSDKKQGEYIVYKDFVFADQKLSYTLEGYIGSGGSVVIPNYFEISNQIFAYYNNKYLESSIFAGNVEIEEITFNVECETIGENAFSGCKNLKKVNIPQKLKVIEVGAFYKCLNLKNINLKDSNVLEKIGTHAFSYCESLEYIILPITVNVLEFDVFEYSSNIIVYCEAESDKDGWDENWAHTPKRIPPKVDVYYQGEWEYNENNIPKKK